MIAAFLRRALPALNLLALSLAGASSTTPHTADGWYALGQHEQRAHHLDAAARAFAQAAALNPSAANWRALADAYAAQDSYADASRAYDEAIKRYRQLGDTQTALALARRAAPYRQELRVFLLDGDPATATLPCAPKRARLEPLRGVLLGTYVNETRQRGDGPIDLRPLSTDAFAVYFRYWTLRPLGQGELFPTRFAAAVRRAGGALHLALEPGVPLSKLDDRTLRAFAVAVRDAGVPTFIRFAAEFNDPTNPWSRDPALYRRTWQRFARVVHAIAPNAAMVWMPMASRLNVVDAYYPGAEAVDWVGVSLYSVPFPNGVTAGGVDTTNPLDVLAPFYARYACQHPFQVSEYAASSRSGAQPGTDFTAFAQARMRQLYWGAALSLPRLKNINWLDLNMSGNAFVQAKAVRLQNDYRLLNQPAKLGVFREWQAEPVFLKNWLTAQGSGPLHVPVAFPARVPAGQSLRAALWLQTATPAARIEVRLDGASLPTEAQLPYRFVLDAARLTPGSHVLTVQARGAGGQVLMQTTQRFTVTPAR